MPAKAHLHEETHLKVLRLLEANPQMNQRDLALALGVSLGKTNFCLKALLDKGLLKMQNFQGSKRKLAYAYLLTPAGIVAKTSLTSRFLKRKMEEYKLLQIEIELLQQEAVAKSTRDRASSLRDSASSLRAQRGNP
jgi:EPS-associated MarR family transcriptional regulator